MEVQTSSCYFQQTGVSDVVAAHTSIEVEFLEFRTSSCYLRQTGVGDSAAASEVEFLEVRTSSRYFYHTGVSDVVAAYEVVFVFYFYIKFVFFSCLDLTLSFRTPSRAIDHRWSSPPSC